MHITIFTIGKHKSAEIDTLFNYYLNLSNNKTKLIKVNQKVLPDKTPNLPMNLSDLISNYNFPNNLFVLTEWGTEYTTEGFINKLNNLQNHESEIAFLVGNAYGWQKDLIPNGRELKKLDRTVYSKIQMDQM